MKPFTASEYYTEWVQAFRAMIPGGALRPAQPAELTPKEAQIAANQEWEHEGGTIKPEKSPVAAPRSKIPL